MEGRSGLVSQRVETAVLLQILAHHVLTRHMIYQVSIPPEVHKQLVAHIS